MESLIQKIEFKGKKPQEISQILREFKTIASETMAEVLIDKKYTTFIQRDREPRLVYEIETIQKQKDELMMTLALKSGNGEMTSFVQKEQERNAKLKRENHLLVEMVQNFTRDKYKEIKSLVKQQEKQKIQETQQLLIAASTGVQAVFAKSSGAGQQQDLNTTNNRSTMIFVSPGKSQNQNQTTLSTGILLTDRSFRSVKDKKKPSQRSLSRSLKDWK